MTTRPNIVFIMTDQERYPVPYESEDLRRFRENELKGRQKIHSHGYVFHGHHLASSACCPSRGSLFTGHLPHLHGVAQTYGFSKNHNDKELFWLETGVVPTMGNYFTAAGYDCQYRGKWHISYENIVDDDGRIVFDDEEYARRDLLRPYGFHGWAGPEPHGHEKNLTGSVRDEIYTKQVCDFLVDVDRRKKANPGRVSSSSSKENQQSEEEKQGEEDKPFLLIASLVNPHDIALTGPLYDTYDLPTTDESVPKNIAAPPTRYQDFSNRPRVHQQFQAFYDRTITPLRYLASSTEMYYYLHKRVDHCIERIYDTLRGTSYFDNTIVILTSDHGEMLSAHGGMQGKWHTAYREVVHVPLVISSPLFVPEGNGPINVAPKALTSHLDIIPTLLDLAGIDAAQIAKQLCDTHSEVHPLVGSSLKPLLTSTPTEAEAELCKHGWVYLTIDDEITRGEDGYLGFSKLYPFLKSTKGVRRDPVHGVAVHLECVVGWLPVKNSDGAVVDHLFKFVRYYDNKHVWTVPGVRDELILHEPEELPPRRLVRTTPCPEEYELYDLTADPTESTNCYGSSSHIDIQEKMIQKLHEERAKKIVDRKKTQLPRPASHRPSKHALSYGGARFFFSMIWLESKRPLSIVLALFASFYLFRFVMLRRSTQKRIKQ